MGERLNPRKCETCNKVLETGDKVYYDGYFCRFHCSWEHMVEYMSDFFSVKEGEPHTLREEDF